MELTLKRQKVSMVKAKYYYYNGFSQGHTPTIKIFDNLKCEKFSLLKDNVRVGVT